MFNQAHQSLLQWYRQHGRHDLPWRQSESAYEIYVSEIMLQQTQVKTVLERFYFPFLEAFPTLEDLANATLDEVLKKWEGLGYYTRARNLHKAAKLCGGVMPTTPEGLTALPGVGRSTAHAIAAFAYNTPVPILDANVKRILYRVFGMKSASEKQLWEAAYRLFDEKHPFEYNQAMMDIGATVCTKAKPACAVCPFASICLAGSEDPLAYPAPKKRKAVPKQFLSLIIYRLEGKLGLYQREGRFLHGLWGFEQVERDAEFEGKYLGEVRHQYSHFHIEAEVYLVDAAPSHLSWFSPQELTAIALSKLDQKAVELLG